MADRTPHTVDGAFRRLVRDLLDRISAVEGGSLFRGTPSVDQIKIGGVTVGATPGGGGPLLISKDPPNYANNAAAIAAGLPVGAIYRNSDVLMVVHP